MKLPRYARRAMFGLLAAASLCSAAAHATTNARIEYVELSRLGSPGGVANLQPVALVGTAQVITAGSSPVTSAGAPTFSDDRGNSVYGHARVTALDGPVIVRKGGSADATHGWRLQLGQSVFIPVKAGETLSVVEDSSIAVTVPTTRDPNNAAFSGVTALTVGTTGYAAGRSWQALCSAAGNVSLTFTDASALVVPVNVGLTLLPYAVTAVNSAGTTATCTYANLK